MKYYVIATRWDNEKMKSVQYIAGEFNKFINAEIFKLAYNEHFSSIAKIVSEFDLINN